jgi:hypothetical protein
VWQPFDYANSDRLVRLDLNLATLRLAVEPRRGGAPVSRVVVISLVCIVDTVGLAGYDLIKPLKAGCTVRGSTKKKGCRLLLKMMVDRFVLSCVAIRC